MRLKKIVVLFMIVLGCTSTTFAFSDLSLEHWAYNQVNVMRDKGIITGFADGTFKPDVSITRAELATLLVKTLKIEQVNNSIEFKDVEDIHWAEQFIDLANNYLTGYFQNGEYYFRPEAYALREDAAVAIVKAKGLDNDDVSLSILNRFSDRDKISENARKYVAIAVKNGIVKGNENGTFNPQGNLTRAEVTALMYNVTEKMKTEGITVEEKKYNESNISLIDVAKVGDYIVYIPDTTEYIVSKELTGFLEDQIYNPSLTTVWRVVSNDGNFVKITSCNMGIAGDCVQESTPIRHLLLNGSVGYINLVMVLNNLCEAYVNPIYAVDGKSIGSTDIWEKTTVDSTKSLGILDIVQYPLEKSARYPIGFPYEDRLYEEDIKLLDWDDDMLSPYGTWLASRHVSFDKYRNDYGACMLDEIGRINYSMLYHLVNNGAMDFVGRGAVFPIITLKSNLEINDGNGSFENPYIIQNPIDKDRIITIADIKIEPESVKLKVGERFKFETTIIPEGSPYTPAKWTINDDTIAKVSNDGVITALKPGVTEVIVYTAHNLHMGRICTIEVVAN